MNCADIPKETPSRNFDNAPPTFVDWLIDILLVVEADWFVSVVIMMSWLTIFPTVVSAGE